MGNIRNNHLEFLSGSGFSGLGQQLNFIFSIVTAYPRLLGSPEGYPTIDQ